MVFSPSYQKKLRLYDTSSACTWTASDRVLVNGGHKNIFRMHLDGMGSVRIMKTLIAEGIPAPEGGLWNASVIMMMLRNEKYAGDGRQQPAIPFLR